MRNYQNVYIELRFIPVCKPLIFKSNAANPFRYEIIRQRRKIQVPNYMYAYISLLLTQIKCKRAT